MTWHSVNPQERLMECRHPANVISHEGLLLLYANRRERPLVWQRTPWFYRGILICQLLFYLFFFFPPTEKKVIFPREPLWTYKLLVLTYLSLTVAHKGHQSFSTTRAVYQIQQTSGHMHSVC